MRRNALAIIFLLSAACGRTVVQTPTPPTEITLEQQNLYGNFPHNLLGADIDPVEPELQSSDVHGLRLVTMPEDYIPVTGYYWFFPNNNDRDVSALLGRILLQDSEFKNRLRQSSMTLAVDSGDEYFLISGRLPSMNFAGGMKLLVSLLKEVKLTKKYFKQAVHESRINDIISGRDIYTQVLNALYHRLYPEGHPLRNKYNGAGTKGVDLQRVKDFYRDNIILSGSTLLLRSDQTHDTLAGELRGVLGSPSQGGAAERPNVSTGRDSNLHLAENRKPIIHIINRSGSVQSGIGLGWLTEDMNHKDYPALLMFSMVMTDRLFHDVRETHAWTYDIFATQQSSSFIAPFIVLTSCSNQHTAACLSAILKHVSYGRSELISDEELAKVKNRVIADINRNLNNPMWSGLQIVRLDGLASFDRWYKNLGEAFQNFTADDIKQAVNRYFNLHPAIVILGDEDIVKSYISQYFPEYSIQ